MSKQTLIDRNCGRVSKGEFKPCPAIEAKKKVIQVVENLPGDLFAQVTFETSWTKCQNTTYEHVFTDDICTERDGYSEDKEIDCAGARSEGKRGSVENRIHECKSTG